MVIASMTQSSRCAKICGGVLLLAFLLFPVHSDANVRVCAYNILFYDSGEFATRDPHLRTVLGAINPDILFLQEISNVAAAQNIRDSILNASGGPGFGDPFVLATTYEAPGDNIDDFLFIRSSKYTEVTAGFQIIAGSPRPARRWRIRPVSDPSGANDIYLYGVHLKAGNTGADATDRESQTASMRSNANALPMGTNIIYCGDFNFYSTEAAYFRFIESQADNDGRAWDPLNPNGLNQNWSANSSYASIHTQSPHSNNAGAPTGATGGGMDDRFDFVLISTSLHDSAGQDYVTSSYRAYGNDGLHYNNDINDAPIIPEGAAMANALHSASDHLPVYLDLTDPISQPQIATTPTSFVGFPQVLTGASVTADITVANSATPPGIALQYSFNQPADYSAPLGTFNLNAGTNAMHTITLNGTATSGNKFGTLSITNNSLPNPKNLSLIGVVLDHAAPSTVADEIVESAMINFGSHDIGQFVDQVASVYNASVPQFPNRVDLSIQSGAISNDAQGRFSLPGFAPPINGITNSTNVTVHFDDTAALPGTYTATLTFTTQDDTLAIGGTALSDVTFNLEATIPDPPGPIHGDFDLNLIVGLEDVAPFVAVLLAPESASPEDTWIADMNDDTLVDSIDLQPFVDAILN